MILKSKKASFLDLFWIVIVVFAFAVFVVLLWRPFSELNDAFQTKLSDTTAKEIMQTNTDRYVGLFDGLFLFILIGLYLATIIGSLFIDTHPAFFFISILLLVILCIVVAVFANTYAELETNSKISTYANDFTYIPFVMQYFVQIVIFMACSVLIALYGKSRLT